MKRPLSWATAIAVAALLGAGVYYYGWMHDWRGRISPGQLTLELEPAGTTVGVALRNNGEKKLFVCESPCLASPFEAWLEPAAGGARVAPAAVTPGPEVQHTRMLEPESTCSWNVSLREIFPGAVPGKYVLHVNYDSAAAARRHEPCADDLALGRVEAKPLEVVIPEPKNKKQ